MRKIAAIIQTKVDHRWFGNLVGWLRMTNGKKNVERVIEELQAVTRITKIFLFVPARFQRHFFLQTAKYYGIEIVVGQDLIAQILKTTSANIFIIVSGNNYLISPEMINRMIDKFEKLSLEHLYFRTTFGIPFNLAEIRIISIRVLNKLKATGKVLSILEQLRNIQDIPSQFYTLSLPDKIWIFTEVAQNNSPYPRVIGLEATNLCNLKCRMCPQHSDAVHLKRRASGIMDFKLYKKIIKQIPKEKDVTLVLHGYGESLLHPRIVDMVRYAKDSNIAIVSFSTNGMLLDQRLCVGLIKAGLDQLDFSIDGMTKEVCEKIMVGTDYNRVIANLQNFLSMRRNSRHPLVGVRLVKQPENEKDIDSFVHRWLRDVDRVTIDECHDQGAINLIPTGRFPCPALWLLTEIYWDGTVPLCNMDAFASIVLGNLSKQSLEEVWQGKPINSLRQRQVKLDFSQPFICARCGWWQCFDVWTKGEQEGITLWQNPVTRFYEKKR